MPASKARRRRRLLDSPLLPLVLVLVGLGMLATMIPLPGGSDDTSPATATTVSDRPRAVPAADPPRPAAGSCTLLVDNQPQTLEPARARTLTQIAAVGRQVKAPAEMAARVLDLALGAGPAVPTVTDALSLFTREDAGAPSASALAELQALAVPGALNCVFATPAGKAERKADNGLTPRAEAARQGVRDAFGKISTSGFGKKARTDAQQEGRALVIAVPASLGAEPRGWVLAHWLTARGVDYLLDTVQVGEHVWRPSTGWSPAADTADAAADEVAIAVIKGVQEKAAEKSAGADKKSAKKSGSKKKSGKND